MPIGAVVKISDSGRFLLEDDEGKVGTQDFIQQTQMDMMFKKPEWAWTQ